MISELLGIPSVSAVSGLKVTGGEVVINRDIDGGKEVVTVPAPVVVIVQKGIAREVRIAAMRGIMMARTKPILVLEPKLVESYTEILEFVKPEPRAACKFVDPENPGQLIELLQNEAKVI